MLTAAAVSPDRSFWQRDISGDSTNQVMISEEQEIAVSGSVVHVLHTGWAQTNNTIKRLTYRRSTDAGLTWEAPVVLEEHPGLEISVGRLQRLAVDGATVHVVSIRSPIWDGGDWYYVIDYYRSVNAGASFEPRRILAQGPAAYHLKMPHIVAANGQVTIAHLFYPNWYIDSQLMVLTSTDAGATFRSQTISRSDKETYSLWDLQRDGDRIAVAWVADSGIPGSWSYTYRLLVGASLDAGATWNFNQVCSTNREGWPMVDSLSDYHDKPDLAWAGNTLYATWTGQDTDDVRQTFVARSVDGGRTFEAPVNLSGGFTRSPQYGQASIAARGRYAYVIWNVPDSGIWLRHSTDGGASWSAARLLFGGWWPMVAIDPESADGRKVHFLATPGLYRSSDDGAETLVGRVSTTTTWSWWNNGVKDFQWAIGPGSVVHMAFRGVQYPYDGSDYDVYYRRLAPHAEPLAADNQCLVLTGSHEELHYENMQIPTLPTFDFRSALTVELWVRPDAGCPHDSTLIYQEHATDYRGTIRLQTHSWNGRRPSGKVQTTNGVAEVWGGELLSDGAWHHVAMTFDAQGGPENLRLYVDGRFSASATAVGPVLASSEPLFVGGGAGGVYQTFRGAVDEVRVWNRALSEAEIRQGTVSRTRASQPGLLAYYPLDGSTREATGRGLDGVRMYRETFAAFGDFPTPSFRGPVLLGTAAGHPLTHEILADWATSLQATGLPPGMTLDTAAGRLVGTPSAPGLYDVTILAANASAQGSQTVRILVRDPAATLFREDFDGPWAAGWDAFPADPSYYHLDGRGCLWLRANNGDTWQNYNRPLNLFAVPTPTAGDWTATLAVLRYEPTAHNYNSLHVVAWDDTDNNVRLTYSYGDGRNVSISGENAQQMVSYGGAQDFGAAAFHLRLSKHGAEYTGAWSTNGVDFVTVNDTAVRMGNGAPAKIGFWMGIDPWEDNVAWVDSFEVTGAAAETARIEAVREAEGLRLTWSNAAGASATLEASDDLQRWWTYNGPWVAGGSATNAWVPWTPQPRFFRLQPR